MLTNSLNYTNKQIALWVPITGADRGKVSVLTGSNGDNYDVDVIVNMDE